MNRQCGLCGRKFEPSGLNSEALMDQAQREYIRDKVGVTINGVCPECWEMAFTWGESPEPAA